MPAATRGRTKRGPGRPPDLAKRQAIVEATLELLAEVGYGSLTIDAVAQRAGSNRVLIYRVWDSKVALVRDVLFGTAADLVLPDTGSLEQDLQSWVRQHVDRMRDQAYLKGVPGLTVELLGNPELFRETHRLYIEPSEQGFATILDRARARHEIPSAGLPERVGSLPFALLRAEIIMTLRPVSDDVIRSIVDEVFLPLVRAYGHGLGATGF